jgi:hypothetical protein
MIFLDLNHLDLNLDTKMIESRYLLSCEERKIRERKGLVRNFQKFKLLFCPEVSKVLPTPDSEVKFNHAKHK